MRVCVLETKIRNRILISSSSIRAKSTAQPKCNCSDAGREHCAEHFGQLSYTLCWSFGRRHNILPYKKSASFWDRIHNNDDCVLRCGGRIIRTFDRWQRSQWAAILWPPHLWCVVCIRLGNFGWKLFIFIWFMETINVENQMNENKNAKQKFMRNYAKTFSMIALQFIDLAIFRLISLMEMWKHKNWKNEEQTTE